jgi:hypothetical protein
MGLALNESGWEEVKDVFEGWREYPLEAVPESAAVNIQSYQDRIADTRSTLFCDSTLETEIEMIDLICKAVH